MWPPSVTFCTARYVWSQLEINPGKLGAVAQRTYFPSLSRSQIVQNIPLPCASTNRARIVRTSVNGGPAKINFRMLSTDSPENRPDSFCGGSTLDRACVEGGWVEVAAPTALSTLISCEESA